MPRGGPPTNTYVLPSIYLAVPGSVILAVSHNSPLEDIADTLNDPWPTNLGGTGGTDAITSFDAINSRGAAIPTASSLDLDAATGANLHLTGTTTVTSVSLGSGNVRETIADGAFILTASASLIVNGSITTNYTTTAGDYLTFIGDPAGVVRVWVTGTSGASGAYTGTGPIVRQTSPTLITPALGTPSSGTLTNTTGFPVANLAGAGTGVLTALAVNVGTAGSPVVNGGVLGTPSSGTLTNTTGFPTANLAGLGAGVATFLATPSSANLATAVTDETGSGSLVFANTPTLVTPVLGAATGTSVVLSGSATAGAFIPSSSSAPTNGMYLSSGNTIGFATNSAARVAISTSSLSPLTTGVSLGTSSAGWNALNLVTGAQLNWGTGGTDGRITSTSTTMQFTLAGTYEFGGIVSTGSTGQVKFPATQNPSSDANTLDDYEEGTWTPSLVASGSTFSYAAQSGVYTKIGRFVQLQGQISLNTSGNTLTASAITLSGLPFTPSSNGFTSIRWVNSTSAYVSLYLDIGTNTTPSIYGLTAGAASGPAAQAANQACHATNGTVLIFTIVYSV